MISWRGAPRRRRRAAAEAAGPRSCSCPRRRTPPPRSPSPSPPPTWPLLASNNSRISPQKSPPKTSPNYPLRAQTIPTNSEISAEFNEIKKAHGRVYSSSNTSKQLLQTPRFSLFFSPFSFSQDSFFPFLQLRGNKGKSKKKTERIFTGKIFSLRNTAKKNISTRKK